MAGLKQGTTLKGGKYKILKVLGQGSFGITYLATTRITMDGQLGKMDVTVNVTIKEFYMSDLNNRATDGTSVEMTGSTLVKNYLGKFQREAQNLSKLHHANIVKVLEVFDENNTTYYVMEFIDGETVDQYTKRKGKLSEDEALIITQEVCSALSYMHDNKMLHLDLKPKNIMRDKEGHIYLIDFGLAKQYSENGEPESSTSLGLGTPGYAPIEQAHFKNDGSFPVTLDIYALGASLFKMLTGKTPPEATDVLNEGLPLAVLKQAGVSDKLIAIVEKAMAPMKKDRYQTVDALTKDISAMLMVDEDRTSVLNSAEDETRYDEPLQQSPQPNMQSMDDENTKRMEMVNLREPEPKETISNEKPDPVPPRPVEQESQPSFLKKYWMYGLAAVVILLGIYFCSNLMGSSDDKKLEDGKETVAFNSNPNSSVSPEARNDDSQSKGKEEEDMMAREETKKNEEAKKQEEAKKKEEERKKEEAKKKEEERKKREKSESSNVSTMPVNSSVNVDKAEADDNAVFQVVEQMPDFPGGMEALMQYFQKNINYPSSAKDNNIQGRVMVTFVINKDGSISNPEIIKSVDKDLDNEALRLIKNMPKWNPGKQKGKPVRVQYTIPVTFRL